MSRRALLLIVLPLLLAGCAARPTETIRSKGDLYFNTGDFSAAAREYEEIVGRYPGDWEAQYMLGRCKLALNQLGDARAALGIAHTRQPGNSDVVNALAEVMYRQGDKSELFVFLKQEAEAEGTVRGWLRVGRYAAELGDPDSAATAFETAIRLDNGRTTEPYLQAAAFAQQIGDLDGATRRLRQAYTIDPEDPLVNKRLRELGEVPGPTIALPTTP